MQRFQHRKTVNKRGRRMLARLVMTGSVAAALALGFALWPTAYAQTPGASRAQPMITAPVNESSLVTLRGNTRPEAKNPANDRGRVDDSLPLNHMQLQLQRPAAQEQAFTTLIDQLHDPNSPNYHHWLTSSQIGTQFGPAAADIAAITGWLQQHGFTVNSVFPNGMTIEFSGTAGQVRGAFHAEIHNLSVNGVAHIANMSDPQIPAALAPVVVGITALNDFKPHPMAVHRPQASPQFTKGSNYYVSPPDLATIYNLSPIFAAGNSGQGQSIYLIEDTDLYSTGDWTTFRSTFGLSGYTSGSLTTFHPGGCADPGVSEGPYGSDGEAIIDAEYASASAPSAAIVMATCKDSPDGILSAVQGLVNSASISPAVMSISYGDCEADNGSASNAAYKSAYQTGVAKGWSIFASAGDQGPAGCDFGGTPVHGINVSALASTVYNVAVGGTDYSDTYSGTNSTYWNSNNSAANGSAQSYVPEIPWNSTCASQLYATFSNFNTTYGSTGWCNSNSANSIKDNSAGSGGPSACATGSPSVNDVVGGTCAGYAKPSWQSGLVGNPSDGVRDLPDVSMFASNAPWFHSFVVCFTDTTGAGVPNCSNPPTSAMGGWGGTSFGSPIWAGIQALVNQYTGSVQGNPNPVLYKLAATEYGASGNSSCNSSSGNSVGSSCIFYDVTLGDNDVPCQADAGDAGKLLNCYLPSGTTGVLSTNNNAYAPAYRATTGWDFATGIGTVNVYNLVTNWATGGAGNAGLTVSVTGGGTVTSNPSDIDCSTMCGASYGGGSQVTLTATPGNGWVFSGWSGACSGTGSCVVTMSAAESVTAMFTNPQALTRTFVSSLGVDTNPCTITAPCATFAHAYTLTQSKGIIAALNPGKYGPLTITYPVTVNGNGWAAITGTAQGNGITINAGSGNVILTGLEVDGAGAAYNGVVFNSGSSLTVSNCIVKDFISSNGTSGNGIMIAPTTGTIDFTIVNTVALNNGSAGVHYLPASGSATATGAIDHVTAANNAIGMAVDLSAASGGSAAVTISNSVANNNTANGIVTASAVGTVTVTADRDEISSNGTGVGVGASTTVLLSRSVIAKNLTYGISNSGTAASSRDNRISGNGNGNVINGTALTSVAQQ
jgi:hypothetical protein